MTAPSPAAESASKDAPISPTLLSLAPLVLPNRRRVRYVGDDLHVVMNDLAAGDGEGLRAVYVALNELLDGFADAERTDAERWEHIEQWCARPERGLNTVLTCTQRLGSETFARNGHGEMLAKVLHDLRGGALTALLGYLQLLRRLPRGETQLRMIFVLTRDHLKIMRNAVMGLDDPRRESDRTPKSHAVRLILEKWHDSVVGPYPPKHERPVQMSVDSRYDGALTECCLESAAIDRIFYNLAANACRHCVSGGSLEMSIFPLPPDGQNLRFVLSNPVSDEDAVVLRDLGLPSRDGATEGIYLDSLFRPAVSSTGSGYGLTVVADFVAGAFGLRDAAEAVAGRYVGVRLDGDIFQVFFHWPAASNEFPQKLDDPHRPAESLSED